MSHMRHLILFLLMVFFAGSLYSVEPVRCKAITRWGQCTNEAVNYGDLCQLHEALAKATASNNTMVPLTSETNQQVQNSNSQPEQAQRTTRSTSSRQCAARTKKGKQCSRKAAEGSAYCWQHSK